MKMALTVFLTFTANDLFIKQKKVPSIVLEPANKKSHKGRFSRLKKFFKDPLTEMHLSFYSSCLHLFTTYNKFLQRLDPLAHKVYPITQDLIKRISMRFLTPESIRQGVTLEILDDNENYLPLEKVFLALTTKKLLNKLFNDGDITKQEYDTCLRGAQSFYKSSLEYILKKMDMTETLWAHAVFVDFFKKESASWSDVEYFVLYFKS